MTLQPHTTEPTFEDRMAAAYKAGAKAKRQGLPQSHCPHTAGTPAWAEWSDGWTEAVVRKTRRVRELV